MDKDPVAVAEELSRLADGASEYEPSSEDSEKIRREILWRILGIHWASEAISPQPLMKEDEPLFSSSGKSGVGEAWKQEDLCCLMRLFAWHAGRRGSIHTKPPPSVRG